MQTGEGVGAERTLTLEDGRQIVDRLDAQGDDFYTYSIVSGPLPVSAYTATMSVKPKDDQNCVFTWSGTFEPQGITAEQATGLFETIYRSGIAMMEKTLQINPDVTTP